jgi:hypothetical protein
MFALRKTLAGLVLANYLFSNTFAAALHDHAECCGHSGPVDQHLERDHAVCGSGNCEAGHREAGHRGHRHCRHSVAGHKHTAPGAVIHAPHHCAVCEFLAHAPLAAPVAALAPCGELPPASVPLAGLLVSTATAGTHLPRGPPALS